MKSRDSMLRMMAILTLFFLNSSALQASCDKSGINWACSGAVLWVHHPWAIPNSYSGNLVILPGDFYGIEFGRAGNVLMSLASGTIANYGNSWAGLTVYHDGSVTNHGTIRNISTLEGIPLGSIMGGGASVRVENFGSVLVGRNYIGLDGTYGSGTSLINSGTIASIGLGQVPGVSDGMTIGILGISGDTVSNSGDITSDYPDSYGILFNGNGQIDNSGRIGMLGDDSLGIFGMTVGTGQHLAINNLLNGVVSVDGVQAEGISVIADGIGESAYIANAGTVSVHGVGAEAIVLQGNGEIRHTGAILAGGLGAEGVVGATLSTNDYIAITTTTGSAVSVTGDDSSGIGITGTGRIDQAGTVDVTGLQATGMYLIGAGSAQGVTTSMANSGQVTVDGDYSVGILGMNSAGATIENEGQVRVSGLETVGIGVTGNRTTVRNTGEVLAAGGGGVGIGIQGDQGTITNGSLGRIEVTELESYGIGIIGDQATVNNAGDIIVGSSDSAGIGVQGGGCSGGTKTCAITSSGTIETHGTNSHGILGVGDNLQVSNDGSIVTRNRGASGIQFGLETFGGQTGGGVSNTGTIETNGSDAYGISAIGEDINVVNAAAGTISTAMDGAHGIVLGSDLIPSSGGVVNLGTIETMGIAAAGIYVTADGAIVDHVGRIVTTNQDAPGIRATGDNQILTVHPGATIVTDGDNSNAIQIVGDDATVSVLRGVGPSLRTFGDDSSAIHVTGDNALLINSATIETSGARAHGIVVHGNSQVDSNRITNIGNISINGPVASGMYGDGDGLTFENAGKIVAIGAGSSGVAMSGNGGSVVNSGAVEVRGVSGIGIELNTTVGQVSLVKNLDEITAVSLGTIAIQGRDGNDTVINRGGIVGSVYLGAGDDTFAFEGDHSTYTGTADGGDGANDRIVVRSDPSQTDPTLGTSAEIAGHLSGFEVFDAEGGFADVQGTIITNTASLSGGSRVRVSGDLQASSNVDISGGASMTLVAGGRLATGQIDIHGPPVGSELSMIDSVVEASAIQVSSGGVLTGTGLIDLSAIDGGGYVYVNGATILPGNSPGTLTIDGNLIFNDGYLGVEVWGTENGMFDVLNITGDAIFNGGMLEFLFDDLFVPTEGDVFEFLLADTISGLETLDFGFSGLPDAYFVDIFRTDRGLGLYAHMAGTAVPAPPTWTLFIIGLLLLGVTTRRRRSTEHLCASEVRSLPG